MPFAYRTWRYFIEWLIETRGRVQFQKLLTACMLEPDSVERHFEQVYGEDVKSAVREYEAMLRR